MCSKIYELCEGRLYLDKICQNVCLLCMFQENIKRMSILCLSYLYLLCQQVFQESGSHIDFRVCCPGMQLLKHVMQTSYGPCQANLVLIAYASSEGSGEPAHPRSLARIFAARSYKQ